MHPFDRYQERKRQALDQLDQLDLLSAAKHRAEALRQGLRRLLPGAFFSVAPDRNLATFTVRAVRRGGGPCCEVHYVHCFDVASAAKIIAGSMLPTLYPHGWAE